MGSIETVAPVTLCCGMIVAPGIAVESVCARLEAEWGPVECRSDVHPFDFTRYYEPEMGKGLRRAFLSFALRVDPGCLAAVKRRTNGMEQEWAEAQGGRRRVNLDPGLVDEGKLVLASTKNSPHRVYVGDGIYAEVSMRFARGAWEPLEWTYPDYRTEWARSFLSAVRRAHLAPKSGTLSR